MEELLNRLMVLMRRSVFPEYLGQEDRALDLMSIRSVLRKIAGDERAPSLLPMRWRNFLNIKEN